MIKNYRQYIKESYYCDEYAHMEDLLGKTFSKIDINKDNSIIKFYTTDGEQYDMFHEQDCSE